MKKLPRRIRDFIRVYPSMYLEGTVYSLYQGVYTGQIAFVLTPPQKIARRVEMAQGTIYAYRLEIASPLEESLERLRNAYHHRPTHVNPRVPRKLHNLDLKDKTEVEAISQLELFVNQSGLWRPAQDKTAFYPIIVDLALIWEDHPYRINTGAEVFGVGKVILLGRTEQDKLFPNTVHYDL